MNVETYNIKDTFGLKEGGKIKAFKDKTEFVPEVDETYQFDTDITRKILVGLESNLKILVQGYHGSGKSTHIEQVAARLNWPCFRLNLDGHISRLDLIGKDAITLEDGQQVTTFKEGVLPWALQQPMILVLDEYDAGRPEVMFVIQRLMEADGALALPDQNRVIKPHPMFRLFGTSNTVGLGDHTGMYQGTHRLNQAQMDRWNMVLHLDYPKEKQEIDIVLAKVPEFHNRRELLSRMVKLAGLTRTGFEAGDLSSVMSPRTVVMWAKNAELLDDVKSAFEVTFINRVYSDEAETLREYYQRVFGDDGDRLN